MLENIHVRKVNKNKGIVLAVSKEDYGKLRGAEEGVYQKIGKGRKKVKRPFFNLSENDKKEIVNNSEFQGTLKRAIKRLTKK